MAKKELKIRALGKYNGHNCKPNGAVDLSFKFSFEELPNYYQALPFFRSEDILVMVKVEDEAAISLGTFMLNGYTFDKDGEGTIKLNSQNDYVELDNINSLFSNKDKLVKVQMRASMELGEENEEDE